MGNLHPGRDKLWWGIIVNKVKIMVSDGRSPDASPLHSSQNLSTLSDVLYILPCQPHHDALARPLAISLGKKKTWGRKGLFVEAGTHSSTSSHGTEEIEEPARSVCQDFFTLLKKNKTDNFGIKQSTEVFRLCVFKSAFCVQPLELSVAARTSPQWTPPSRCLRCFNFSPRSGRMRWCRSIVSRNKVGREQKPSWSSACEGAHITNSFIVSDRWIGEVLFFALARSEELS